MLLRLGSVGLRHCPARQPGWCGSIRRALEPGVRGAPSIPIGFEWLPASGRRSALGTVVEGGPGFPSTGSIVEYRGIFGPLLRARNLLLVDNRGTGKSALIRCPTLDSYPGPRRASGPRFARLVGACGRALNHRYRTRSGAWVHASDLFGTAYVALDLRAVLRRLGLRRVDLYGDSYGSWFAQAFHRPVPRCAALGDPRLHLSGPRPRPVLRVLGVERARRPGPGVRPRSRLFGGRSPWLARRAARRAPGSSDPGYFSDGDYMAVGCTDYPQLFSLRAGPAARRRQLRRSVRDAPAGVFDPFTAPEWVSMSGYSETYDTCLDWPAPRHRAPVLPAAARPLPASVPLLIVGGDLDDLTPLSDAERFGPALGGLVRVVDLVNTVHVTSEGDTFLGDGAACARAIMRRFVLAPARLAELDTSCAASIPHIHTPGAYPRRLRGALPAVLLAGPDPGLRARRAATVAADAFADATIRRVATGSDRGLGLRGGRFSSHGPHSTLSAVRFVSDAAVNGTGTLRLSAGAVRARLTVIAGRRRFVVTLGWDQRSLYARARVGSAVLRLPAP